MITRKAGPALAAGCTGVIKPASQTPVLGAGAWRCWPSARACRPASATSSPAPSGEIGGELTANPLVRKLTFTGSTEVGTHAAGAVRADHQEDLAWSWAATRPSSSSTTPTSTRRSRARWSSKYRNTGQTCVCANRILVQDGVYDAFAAKLTGGGGRR